MLSKSVCLTALWHDGPALAATCNYLVKGRGAIYISVEFPELRNSQVYDSKMKMSWPKFGEMSR